MRLSQVALVMVMACSGTPHDPPAPRATPVDNIRDAASDDPIDAAPIDAAVAYDRPCDWQRIDPSNPRCALEKMPLMRCRDVGGPSDRFPKCIEDKKAVVKPEPIVLAIKKRRERTERGIPIVVDGGTNRGIDKTWRARLVDRTKGVFSDSLEYARLDPDEIELLVQMPTEWLDRASSVRFVPPDGS
jgi:hypothetical protein